MTEESTSIFEGLFDREVRTDEEREADRLKEDRNRNERARMAFEKEQTRRDDYLALDHRIRGIVREELNKAVIGLGFVGAAFWAGNKYGWLGTIGVFAVGGVVLWWETRKAEKLPSFKIDEVDRMAEDIVALERLAEFVDAGKPWYSLKATYVDDSDIFEFPYWERVNARVRLLVKQSHSARQAELHAVRAATLSARRELQARLTEQGKGNREPYWARIGAGEG